MDFIKRIRSLECLEEHPEPLPQVRKYPVWKINYWESCLILHQARIPYKIWSHRDVLTAYGTTQHDGGQELHLLVNDVEKASQILQERGYLRTAVADRYQGDSIIFESRTHRLVSPTVLDEGFSRKKASKNPPDPAEVLANIRNGYEGLSFPGVALLAAQDWGYRPLNPEDDEPVPALHEYFNSYVSLWLAGGYDKLWQGWHIRHVIDSIVTELDEAWSVEFEAAIKVMYRPILFDLMQQRHEQLAYPFRVGPLYVMLECDDFRLYHRNRVEREMSLQDLPSPVLSPVFIRERPRLTINEVVERSEECPIAVGYRKALPRLTWLVKIPAGEGWVQISLNLPRLVKDRREKRRSR